MHSATEAAVTTRPKTLEHVLLERAVVIGIEPKSFWRAGTEPLPRLSGLVEEFMGIQAHRLLRLVKPTAMSSANVVLPRPIDAVYADEVAPRTTESLDLTDDLVEHV